MAKVYPFPSLEDRAVIKASIVGCAASQISTNKMNKIISGIMRRYKDVRSSSRRKNRPTFSIIVNDVRVTDCGDFTTLAGKFPVVTLEALRISEDGTCPACGVPGFGWLRGDKNLVVVCEGCGCIYERRADGEEIG